MLFFSEILVIGGYKGRASMEYYSASDPEQNSLVEQRMSTGRSGHVSVVMSDGRILTAGGNDENREELSSTELFDARTGRVQTATDMTERRYLAAAAVIDDAVYVCGGWNRGSKWLSSCERFVSNEWIAISSMKEERGALAMVAIDGKLFAIGGGNGSRLSSVERFDPKSGQWQFVSRMRKGRFWHGAAVLNGQIYVCGGFGSGGRLRDCECYEPERNRWETVAAMNRRRRSFNLVAMNGRLYAVGGRGSGAETSVESYDPNRNEWTLLNEPLIEPRKHASAVVL